MTLGQNICLAVPSIISAFWSYVFISGNTDVYQQNHGKMPSGQDTYMAFSIAGVYIATMVFFSLASLFHTDAVKRLVLRAYALSYAGSLYLVYQNKGLFLPEAFKTNMYILWTGFGLAFLGAFVLSPAANEKKKRF